MSADAVLAPMRRTARVTRARGRAIADPLEPLRRAFERRFARVLPAASVEPARLHRAMRYSALSGGKRLRPLLALTACEAVGGRWSAALPAAVAVECVHAFSLIHDDLPCMDDDDFRRGRPTTHRKFGEALALLAGDALLALAFGEVARLGSRGSAVSDARVVEAVRVLARAAGSTELVGGQVLDIQAEGRPVTGAGVREIHRRKTGALIAASLVLGGIAGGASRATLRELERAGREVGLAFQIHDDLLNRESSLRRLGKRTGTDDARKKATYPRAVGEPAARREAALRLARARRRLARLGPRASRLDGLLLAVAHRER